MAEFLEDNFSV